MDMVQNGIQTIRNADFPVYAVTPSRWDGDVMFSGGMGTTKHPGRISLRYDQDVTQEPSSARIEIASAPGPESFGPAPMNEDLKDQFSYYVQLINFVHNATTQRLPERPVPGSERFNATEIDGRLVPRTVYLPSAGPRRLLEDVALPDGRVERVAFEEYPDLRLYRQHKDRGFVLVIGWGYDDDFLTNFVRLAHPMQDDAGLFAEFEQAQRSAWEKIYQRKRRRGEA